MVRIDLGALNDKERERFLRNQKRPTLAAGRQIPTVVHVLLIGAGFGALTALAYMPWSTMLGAALVVVGAYGVGVRAAPGERAARDEARADRLTDALAFFGLAAVDGRSRDTRPERASEAGQPLRRNARFPGRKRGRLRAIRGGVAPGTASADLDRPLPGESDIEGAAG